MKVGLIVICRYNSSRLPGKILKNLGEKPLLAHILDRLSVSAYASNIIVATSDESTDDPIANYCKQNEIDIFRGSLNNVSQRFADCMEANELDYAVRINGDNVFTDAHLIDEAVHKAVINQYDFVSNVKGRTYPTGMSVEVVKVAFYLASLHLFTQKNYQEHVTLYFYEHEPLGKYHFIKNSTITGAKGMKLAVDTPEDFKKANAIIHKMKKPFKAYSWKEIIEIKQDLKKKNVGR